MKVKILQAIETDKTFQEWCDDFLDWLESRNEAFANAEGVAIVEE